MRNAERKDLKKLLRKSKRMKTPKWFLKRNLIAYLLLPLSLIYLIASNIVFIIRRFNRKTSNRPVICIGNILSGGVGKTPIVMQIAKKHNAPVVTRGYKKNSNNEIGDEAKMMNMSGIDVYAGNRKASIDSLNLKKSKKPIIMDDGFQNSGIKKDLSIIVFDGKIGVGNGFVLPAGPLRETTFAINRADAVIIIKSEYSDNNDFQISTNTPVFYAKTKNIMPSKTKKYIAFAGIGYPDKFFNALTGNVIDCVAFADHYQYTKNDIDNLFKRAKQQRAELLTTMKDWVRLPADIQKKISVAKQETVIDNDFWMWLKEKLK